MPTRVALKPDPLGLPRNPLAVFLLVLTLISGLMQALGLVSTKSVEAALPHYVGVVWGWMLVLGAGHTLLGMYWPGLISTGLLLKRVGMFALTIASFFYAVTIVVAFGLQGLFTAGIILGFSLACGVQFKRLNDRVKAIIAVTKTTGEHHDQR